MGLDHNARALSSLDLDQSDRCPLGSNLRADSSQRTKASPGLIASTVRYRRTHILPCPFGRCRPDTCLRLRLLGVEDQHCQEERPYIAIQYERLLGEAAEWRLGNDDRYEHDEQ